MAKIFGLLLLCALLGATTAQNALAGQFPAHVAIHIGADRFGEGVILNANHVLTVAQNVFDPVTNFRLAPENITVRAGVLTIGANPGPALPVLRIYAHDHYNFHTRKFNVAVLRMTNNFTLTPDNALPLIDFVTFHNRIVPEAFPVGTPNPCVIVGWNNAPATLTTALQAVPLPVLARATCSVMANPLIRGSVFDQHICAGAAAINLAVCNNNDGAGLYCHGELVGLRVVGRQCNQANSPAVFIQTRWFQDWIPQQFTRTDNPAPGPVPPPGISEDNSATMMILSSAAVAFAVAINLLAL